MNDIAQKPLNGIKVVDLTLAGSGPSCTKLLAEYGAQVIWVEPLYGTSTRTVHKYDFYTTNKKSISLNLKTEKGKDVLQRIIEDSDVFVSNYRPKALAHLHLTYDEVKKINEQIIYATLTGFGEEGTEANRPGYDAVAFWAKGGLLSDIAESGSLVVPPVAIGDIASGLSLFGGICAALLNQKMNHIGCHISTSLLATSLYLNHDALIEVQYGEKYPKTRKAPRRALFNTYQCKDDQWIAIALLTDFNKNFPNLLRAIHLDTLINDIRWKCIEDTMYENAPELVEILDKAFAEMTQQEALEALMNVDIPVSKVQHTKDLLTDPQVLANQYIYPLEATVSPSIEQKEILVPSSPIKINSAENGTIGHTKGPQLGEHTLEILRQYHFTEEEIAELSSEGIINYRSSGIE